MGAYLPLTPLWLLFWELQHKKIQLRARDRSAELAETAIKQHDATEPGTLYIYTNGS